MTAPTLICTLKTVDDPEYRSQFHNKSSHTWRSSTGESFIVVLMGEDIKWVQEMRKVLCMAGSIATRELIMMAEDLDTNSHCAPALQTESGKAHRRKGTDSRHETSLAVRAIRFRTNKILVAPVMTFT
eukprot:scaffold918_cov126-Cylindrotheca_fusiformis.AAC.83